MTSSEPRWLWKKKILLYCTYIPKLKKDQLIQICDQFDINHSGLKNDIIYRLNNHIQLNIGSPILSKDSINFMIHELKKIVPENVQYRIDNLTTESLLLTLPTSNSKTVNYNNSNKSISLLKSDQIRIKHLKHIDHTNQNSLRTNTHSNNNTHLRHSNKTSYSFPELSFYPRIKLLDQPYISPITNKKLKKKFEIILNQQQYNGIQNNEYKIFFFCGAIPINIDIESDSDTDSDGEKHETIQICFPQTYQFINMRTGVSLERHATTNNKKRQKFKTIDITDLLSNEQRMGQVPLQFSFHFVPSTEYYMCIYLVRAIKTDELVTNIIQHTKILKNATLYYLAKSQDSEFGLQTTSLTLSLECPISGSRIKTPIKSVKCSHIECFDAFWYLESQRQIENGRCPICSKFIKFDDLAVSEFIEEILERTPQNCRKVQLSNNGSWVPIIDSDDSEDDSEEDENSSPTSKRQKIFPDTQFTPANNNKIKDNITFTNDDDNYGNNSNEDNSPMVSERVPNILGSTPLNRNNYKGLPTTKTYNNLAAIGSSLEEEDDLVDDSQSYSFIDSNTTPIQPSKRKNVVITKTLFTADDTLGNDIEESIETSNCSELTVIHNNIGNHTNTNILSNLFIPQTVTPSDAPNLPELPSLPLKFTDQSIQDHTNISKQPTRKPIIVPFNSRINERDITLLPQKRQLSESNLPQ